MVDVTGLTVSISPLFSTSKILVMANLFLGPNNSTIISWQLVRNSTAISIGTGGSVVNATGSFVSDAGGSNNAALIGNGITYQDSPATTSSTTYKVQLSTNNGTVVYINRRSGDAGWAGTSSITVMEIAQ
jgi:hypothetical protein